MHVCMHVEAIACETQLSIRVGPVLLCSVGLGHPQPLFDMPPKDGKPAKAKAAPKANSSRGTPKKKAAPKAAPLKTRDFVPVQAAELDESHRASLVVAESSLASSAKKLRRWDSDDYAERKIRDKLGGFDKFEVENAVGKTTALNIKEYIMQHYRNSRDSKGNLACSFWVV